MEQSLNLCIYHHETLVSAGMLGPPVCAFPIGLHPLTSAGALRGPEAPRLVSPVRLPLLLLVYVHNLSISPGVFSPFRPPSGTSLLTALDVWANLFYFKMHQSKGKQIFWFRMSLVFYSWPLLNLAVCGKEKKKWKIVFSWGFIILRVIWADSFSRRLRRGPGPSMGMFKQTRIITLSFGKVMGLKNQFETPRPKAVDGKRRFPLLNCLYFHKCCKPKANLFPKPIVHTAYKYDSFGFPSLLNVCHPQRRWRLSDNCFCCVTLSCTRKAFTHWGPIRPHPQSLWQPEMHLYILNTSKEYRTGLWLRTYPHPSPTPFFPSFLAFSGPLNITLVLYHCPHKVYDSYPLVHLSPLLPAPILEYLDNKDHIPNSVSYKCSINVPWGKNRLTQTRNGKRFWNMQHFGTSTSSTPWNWFCNFGGTTWRHFYSPEERVLLVFACFWASLLPRLPGKKIWFHHQSQIHSN